jgi:gamma-glutamyltranspeptidase
MQIEDAFDPSVLRALERMGHSFRRISLRGELRMGYGAAVLVRDARAIAGADPRRSGAAGAVR